MWVRTYTPDPHETKGWRHPGGALRLSHGGKHCAKKRNASETRAARQENKATDFRDDFPRSNRQAPLQGGLGSPRRCVRRSTPIGETAIPGRGRQTETRVWGAFGLARFAFGPRGPITHPLQPSRGRGPLAEPVRHQGGGLAQSRAPSFLYFCLWPVANTKMNARQSRRRRTEGQQVVLTARRLLSRHHRFLSPCAHHPRRPSPVRGS